MRPELISEFVSPLKFNFGTWIVFPFKSFSEIISKLYISFHVIEEKISIFSMHSPVILFIRYFQIHKFRKNIHHIIYISYNCLS